MKLIDNLFSRNKLSRCLEKKKKKTNYPLNNGGPIMIAPPLVKIVYIIYFNSDSFFCFLNHNIL